MVIRLRTRLPPREIRLLTRETLTQVPKEKRAVLPSLTVTMMIVVLHQRVTYEEDTWIRSD